MAMKKNLQKILLLAAVAAFAVYCDKKEHGEHGKAHWNYNDIAQWGEVSAACAEGKSQSPIDLNSSIDSSEDESPVSVSYQVAAQGATIVNNGHTVQINYPAGSFITINGKEYEVLQFHFHAPSEHTVDGKAIPLEMHIVHKNAGGELAVLGVLIENGGSDLDAFFSDFEENVQNASAEASPVNGPVDLTKVIDNGALSGYYKYNGSLTTPPCSEAVEWRVLHKVFKTNSSVIKTVAHLFGGNARPVQNLNQRKVTVH